jgi:hypothetical protein
MAEQFLYALTVHFPDVKIFYRKGNHEDRYDRYVMDHASELWGIEEVTYESVLHVFDYGIEIIRSKRPVHYGALTLLHGDEYKGFISTVNPARTAFLRAKETVLIAHSHQTSQHTEPTVRQNDITAWSIGCLCDLHPSWGPLNKWNWGFAILERLEDDEFLIDNLRISRKGHIQ